MSGEFGLVIFGTLIPCSPKVKEMGCRLGFTGSVSLGFPCSLVGDSGEPGGSVHLGNFRKRSILQEETVLSSKKPVFFRGHEPFVLGGGVTLDALRDQLILNEDVSNFLLNIGDIPVSYVSL